MQIFIPTLGRIDNQITYNNFPESWKRLTKFVVQTQEYEDFVNIYGQEKIICLPDNIKVITSTRKYIYDILGSNIRHMVFDDDLKIRKKYPNPSGIGHKWITEDLEEKDYDDILKLINSWIDQGYYYGGLMTSANIPDMSPNRYPVRENHRLMTNFFFDGSKLPIDLEWERVPFGEDLDITLQLLSRGYKNICSSHYIVFPSPPNSKGGCSTYRNLENHNRSQEILAELWPKYVKVITKEGDARKRVTIQFKKVYKDFI